MARSNSIHSFGLRCNCVQNFLSGWFRLNQATNERTQMRHEIYLHCSLIHEQIRRGKPDRNFLRLSGGSLQYRVTILLSPGEDLDWPARIDMPADNPMSADLRLNRRGVDQAT
jgi:hypothetical protein